MSQRNHSARSRRHLDQSLRRNTLQRVRRETSPRQSNIQSVRRETSPRPSTSHHARRETCPRPSTSHHVRRDSSSSCDDDNHNLSQQTRDDLRENEKKMCTLAACKYILAMTRKKLPIKCADVVKHCMHGNNRLYADIFALVSKHLSDVSLIKLTINFFFS